MPSQMIKQVQRDFAGVELGDPRRRQRLMLTLRQLGRKPNRTVPEAMGSESLLEGAYRLMNNPWVSFDALKTEHAAATQKRAVEAGAVLVVHDTSACQFSHGEARDLGYLSTGKPGFYLHSSLVVDMASWRRPLGVIHAETIHRSQRRKRKGQRHTGAETARWKDRESERWWRGVSDSAQQLKHCDAVLHVMDREGDSYELLGRMGQAKDRFVVRVRHDHRTAKDSEEEAAGWGKLRTIVEGVTGVIERDVALWARKGKRAPQANKVYPARRARIARLQFSAKTVHLKRPGYVDPTLPKTLELNVVYVTEINPPEGEPAVEWLLYTSEPIHTATHVARVVDIYRSRWLIEEFFAALKGGCLYEQRQFESKHALLNLLALMLPIACQLLWLRSRARTDPNSPATDVLTQRQIQILRVLGPRKLSDHPTVGDVTRMIAEMGGHRRSNGPPGWRILQRGFTTLQDYEIGWAAARSHHANIA